MTNVLKKTMLFLIICIGLFYITGCSFVEDFFPNDEPKECFYDGEKFYWNDLKGVDEYILKIFDGEKTGVDGKSIQLKQNEYEYNIESDNAKVELQYKNIDENFVPYGEYFEFKKISVFETPVYDHGTISWSEVEGATKYLVKVNNKVKQVYDTHFELESNINNDVSIKPVLSIREGYVGQYYTYSVPQNYDILDTPSFASFKKDTKTISWYSTNNASGYHLLILFDGKTVVDQPALGSMSTYYDSFPFDEAGEYTVKLAANSNSSSGKMDSRYVEKNIEKLSDPTNVVAKEEEGKISITWDSVKGAEKYRIILPNGNTDETRELSWKYNYEHNTNETQLSFKVIAVSSNDWILDSPGKAVCDITLLGTVKNIKVSGEKLTWDIVEKSQGYVVTLDGTEYGVDTNEFSFEGYSGEHTVKIKAKGNGNTIISSAYSPEIKIYKLSSPTEIRFENGVLKWTGDSKAKSYKVILSNGTSSAHNGTYSATTNSYNISRTDLLETKTIQIQAIGDGLTIIDSNLSNPFEVKILDAPTVSLTKDGIIWSRVNNAVSYTVYIDDYKISNLTGTSLNISEDDYAADIYTVSVVAVGDAMHYFDSEKSEPISMKILNKPDISDKEDGTGIKWPTVISATEYQIRIDSGDIVTVGYETRNYNVKFTTAGTHNISMRAIGDGLTSITSGWMDYTVQTKKLSTPSGVSIVNEDGKLIFTANEVANASEYKFRIGSVEYFSSTNVYEFPITIAGEYATSAAAVGNGYKFIDSDYSSEKIISVLTSPSNCEFTKVDSYMYLLTWKPVDKAVSYNVVLMITYKDGTYEEKIYNLAKTELKINTTDVSTLGAKVIAKGNGTSTFDSVTVEPNTVFVK